MWREPAFQERTDQARYAKLGALPQGVRKIEVNLPEHHPLKPGMVLTSMALTEMISQVPFKVRTAPDATVEEAVAFATKIGQMNQEFYDVFSKHVDRLDNDGAADQPWMKTIEKLARKEDWRVAGSGFFSVVFTKGKLAIKLGTKAEDSGAAYAAWARDNSNLEGVPVIHDIQRFGRQSFTVVMPRYDPIICNRTAEAVRSGNMGAVSATYKKIENFFLGVARMDLHSDNIMRDPVTGGVIITDPVSFVAGAKDF